MSHDRWSILIHGIMVSGIAALGDRRSLKKFLCYVALEVFFSPTLMISRATCGASRRGMRKLQSSWRAMDRVSVSESDSCRETVNAYLSLDVCEFFHFSNYTCAAYVESHAQSGQCPPTLMLCRSDAPSVCVSALVWRWMFSCVCDAFWTFHALHKGLASLLYRDTPVDNNWRKACNGMKCVDGRWSDPVATHWNLCVTSATCGQSRNRATMIARRSTVLFVRCTRSTPRANVLRRMSWRRCLLPRQSARSGGHWFGILLTVMCRCRSCTLMRRRAILFWSFTSVMQIRAFVKLGWVGLCRVMQLPVVDSFRQDVTYPRARHLTADDNVDDRCLSKCTASALSWPVYVCALSTGRVTVFNAISSRADWM